MSQALRRGARICKAPSNARNTSTVAAFSAKKHTENIVTHWMTPETRESFDFITKVIEGRYARAAAAPSGSVDWDHWRKQLEDKKFVDDLKAGFDKMDFEVYKTTPDPAEAKEWETLLAFAEKRQDVLHEELRSLYDKLAQLYYDRTTILHWNFFDWQDRFPEAIKETVAETHHLLLFPTDTDLAVYNLDMAPYTKQLSQGIMPDIPELRPYKYIAGMRPMNGGPEIDALEKKFEETGGNLLVKAADILRKQVDAAKIIDREQQQLQAERDAAAEEHALAIKSSQINKVKAQYAGVDLSEQTEALLGQKNPPLLPVLEFLLNANKFLANEFASEKVAKPIAAAAQKLGKALPEIMKTPVSPHEASQAKKLMAQIKGLEQEQSKAKAKK